MISLNEICELSENPHDWVAKNIDRIVESLYHMHNLEITIDLLALAIDRENKEEIKKILGQHYEI